MLSLKWTGSCFGKMSGVKEECGPSPFTAAALSVAVSLGYVGMLYLPFNAGDRNRPRTIASRQFSSVAFVLSCEACLTHIALRRDSPSANTPTSFRDYAGATGTSLILTLLLYTGALLACFDFRDPFPRFLDEMKTTQQRWISFRNYLASPLVEEVLFRQQALNIWQCAPSVLRVVSPAVLFGAAHLHHAATHGIAPALFQFVYTSLFGMYAALLYLQSGTLVAPFTAHVTCNYLGIPDFGAIARHKWPRALSAVYVTALMAFAYSLSRGTLLFATVYSRP